MTDPIGCYTPEADLALADAYDARARSAYLRKELRDTNERTDRLTKADHKSVNDGMTQKFSETVTLKVLFIYLFVFLYLALLLNTNVDT